MARDEPATETREGHSGRHTCATTSSTNGSRRPNVEVERVPVGRVIDEIPPVEGDADHTIIPSVEETVVVERKLLLREELHIRRWTTRTEGRSALGPSLSSASISRP